MVPTTDPDERTVEAEAFGAMFAELRPSAERYAHRLTGDAFLAEDIAAEAFARMWRYWSSERIDRPWGYLRRIVMTEVVNHHRRTVRADRAVPPWSTTESPAADHDLGDRDDAIQLLASLPATQCAVLSLRYLEDLSESQIAARLGISPGTVKSAASRGLAKLRTAVDPPARAA